MTAAALANETKRTRRMRDRVTSGRVWGLLEDATGGLTEPLCSFLLARLAGNSWIA